MHYKSLRERYEMLGTQGEKQGIKPHTIRGLMQLERKASAAVEKHNL